MAATTGPMLMNLSMEVAVTFYIFRVENTLCIPLVHKGDDGLCRTRQRKSIKNLTMCRRGIQSIDPRNNVFVHGQSTPNRLLAGHTITAPGKPTWFVNRYKLVASSTSNMVKVMLVNFLIEV